LQQTALVPNLLNAVRCCVHGKLQRQTACVSPRCIDFDPTQLLRKTFDTVVQIICGGQMWRGPWGASPTSGHPAACPAITPSKVTALCRHKCTHARTHAPTHAPKLPRTHMRVCDVYKLSICMRATDAIYADFQDVLQERCFQCPWCLP